MKVDRLNHLRFVLADRAEDNVNYTDRAWIRLASLGFQTRIAASWEGFACLDREFMSLGLYFVSELTKEDLEMPFKNDQDVLKALQDGVDLFPKYQGLFNRDAILNFFGLSIKIYEQLCPVRDEGETDGSGLIEPVKNVSKLLKKSSYISPFMMTFGR